MTTGVARNPMNHAATSTQHKTKKKITWSRAHEELTSHIHSGVGGGGGKSALKENGH